MSLLSTVINQDVTDPRKEGYPCFGIFASDGGNTYMNSTVYNSQFDVISPPYMGVGSTTTSYQFGMAGDAMYAYSGDQSYNTQSALSTESASSAVFSASLHNVDQYPSGILYDCSSLGYRTGNSIHATAAGRVANSAFLINHVLPSGVRPRRFFCINANIMYEVQSLVSMDVAIDRIDLAPYRAQATNTDCYGAACYNENTKTLVVTWGTTSVSTSVNIFKSTTVDLNSCANLLEFFASCTVTGFLINRTTYNSQSRYDRCLLVGDNDLIFMAYRVNNNIQADLINPTAQTNTALATVAGTTSYGVDQGNAYDTKFNLTWNGKWAAIYQPYYYYGCGVCGYVISVEDPSRYFTYLDTTSSSGGSFMPLGESSFCYFRGENTDSNGVFYNKMDFLNTSKTGTAATVYTNSSLLGVQTAINNGAALNTTVVTSTLSGGGYTTNYPNFMVVNWWPLLGKRSYEGITK